jgi:hypothetical protein
MPLPLSVRVTFAGNLLQADRIIQRNVNNAFDALGRHLQKGVRGRVRYFQGGERKGVKYEVTGRGLNKFLDVFGELMQHVIDELGLPPGVFPPFGPGTRIYTYAKGRATRAGTLKAEAQSNREPRKASHVGSRRPKGTPGARRVGASHAATAARRVGRAARARKSPASALTDRRVRRSAFLIARAIFERGIRAGEPFGRTLTANRSKILTDVSNAFVRAVNEINR